MTVEPASNLGDSFIKAYIHTLGGMYFISSVLRYLLLIAGMTYEKRSKFFLKKLAKKLHVHLAQFDRYICPICWQGGHPQDGYIP